MCAKDTRFLKIPATVSVKDSSFSCCQAGVLSPDIFVAELPAMNAQQGRINDDMTAATTTNRLQQELPAITTVPGAGAGAGAADCRSPRPYSPPRWRTSCCCRVNLPARAPPRLPENLAAAGRIHPGRPLLLLLPVRSKFFGVPGWGWERSPPAVPERPRATSRKQEGMSSAEMAPGPT